MHGDALIEPGLLSNRTYISGILVAIATFGAFGGVLLCVSLFTQLGEGFSPIHAGLTLTPMVVGMVIGMAVSFALVKRLGRRLIQIGVALIAAGAVVLALTVTGSDRVSTWDLAPALFLIGDRRRRQPRPAVRLHPRRRRHGGSRLRLRRPRGGPAARQRDSASRPWGRSSSPPSRATSPATPWRSPPGPAWSPSSPPSSSSSACRCRPARKADRRPVSAGWTLVRDEVAEPTPAF